MMKTVARVGKWLLGAAAVCTIATATSATAAPTSRVVGAAPHWATASRDLGVAPAGSMQLTIGVARSPDRQRAFDEFRAAQQTPGSPHFHQWLTPAQLGAQFGASDADLAHLTQWLAARGLKVTHISASREFVSVTAPRAAIATAFATQFHRYQLRDRVTVAHDRAITLPADIAPLVAHVRGLDQLAPRPLHHRLRPVGTSLSDGSGGHIVAPADFATIYDSGPAYASGLDGTGHTIGIISEARVLASDITNFATVTGATLATTTVVIPPDGVDPGPACGDDSCANDPATDFQIEATLDVTRAASIAPGANIEIITSTDSNSNDGLDIALQDAVTDFGTIVHSDIITASFGFCEDDVGQDQVMSYDELFQEGAAQGQTIFVSSGDSGAAGCEAHDQAPESGQARGMNALCSSAAVTCVGGTEFNDTDANWDTNGNAIAYIPEGAWNEPLDQNGDEEVDGTGGGVSEFVSLPPYQASAGLTGSGRLTPDMAFTAAGHDGYLICIEAFGFGCEPGTQLVSVGGTSASSPSMAGAMALVDQHAGSAQGAANTLLYQLATGASASTVFHDVTLASSGVASCDVSTPSLCNNTTAGPDGLQGGVTGFAVATGFDEATGWGSLDIAKLIVSWPSAPPSLLADPSTFTVTAGDSQAIALTAGGFSGSISFSCDGLPTGAHCAFSGSGPQSSLSITTTGTGTSAATAGASTDTRGGLGGGLIGWLLTAALAAMLAHGRQPLRSRRRALVLSAAFALAVASCGTHGELNDGGGPGAGPTPAGTYGVTVTATDGTNSAIAALSMTVTAAP